MSPNIQGLIMQLKNAENIVQPRLPKKTKTRLDVWFMEYNRNIAFESSRAKQWPTTCKPILTQKKTEIKPLPCINVTSFSGCLATNVALVDCRALTIYCQNTISSFPMTGASSSMMHSMVT